MISGGSIGSCWVIWRLLWRVWCQPTVPMSGPSMVAWSDFAGTCRAFCITGSSMTRYVEFTFPHLIGGRAWKTVAWSWLARKEEAQRSVWVLEYRTGATCVHASVSLPPLSYVQIFSLSAWHGIDVRGMSNLHVRKRSGRCVSCRFCNKDELTD